MKDCQKVYIKGNHKKGNEIIKLLENLGGRNVLSYTGINEDVYYYISPLGIIALATPTLVLYLKKSHYKEIKLPSWKPEYQGQYYFIDIRGGILQKMWFDTQVDNLCYKFGNCFRTQKEAEAARDKFKEILNK